MEQIALALKLDPNDIGVKFCYGYYLFYTRRYNDAIAVGREMIKEDSVTGEGVLMWTLHLAGRYDEALNMLKKAYYRGYPGFVHAFDQGYAKAGYFGALSLEADTLFAQSKTAYVNPGDIALLYVCAGNKKRALDCLERGFEIHDINVTYLVQPIYDCLRNEPRFQALCKKMNFPIK